MSVEELAAGLTKAQRRNIVKTPHPQPLPGKWLWPGSVSDAVDCAKLGLLDKSGFTDTGLAVRSYLMENG